MNILVGGLLLLFLCLLQTHGSQSVLLLYLIIFALQLAQLFGLLLGMVLQKFKELVKLQHIGLRRGIGILLQLLQIRYQRVYISFAEITGRQQ